MNSRISMDFQPPHTQPASYIIRYFENLMELTYHHPALMSGLIHAVGVGSLVLASSPVIASALGYDAPVGVAGALAAGTVSAIAYGSRFAQNNIFGFPVDSEEQVYKPSKFTYNSATAEIILSDDKLPLLKIVADNNYDAGYAEGFILAHAIKENLAKTDFLYTLMRLGMNAPKHNADLRDNLAPILKVIPKSYQDEMHGKVDAYNDWLDECHPESEKLTFERYVLLQLLPDLRNYNPFPARKWLNSHPDLVPNPACTSIAVRLGNYTFFTRVLDWPSHGVAGKYFMQIDRKIGDTYRHIDTGFPLLSGVLTDINEKGLFCEMNVAHGPTVQQPEGIPATLFNRYIAEHGGCVADIPALLEKMKPVGAYHLTASDGKETKSFHFYQSQTVKNEDVVEVLSESKFMSQTLVVANHGVQFDGDKSAKVNHRDSNERVQNILRFFDQAPQREMFKAAINHQKDNQKLSEEDINELRKIFLQAARLALVSNCESVLCEILVFCGDKIQSAIAATDNLYAQRKELNEFKHLHLP